MVGGGWWVVVGWWVVGGGWWVVGGWWMGGGWRLARSPRWPRIVKKRNLPRLFPVSYKVLKNQLTAPRVPGVLLYVLLHCCTAVCSKGLVGGWVEDALRRPWWVGSMLLFCFFSTYIKG